jgi:hypothetical protein
MVPSPIITYGRQGTLKFGVHIEDHAIIYSTKTPNPLRSENTTRLRPSIRVRMDRDEKLDATSRLNYAKLYTVEMNVKLCFIGRVASAYESQVMADFNSVNQPFDNMPPSSADDRPMYLMPAGYDPTHDTMQNTNTFTYDTSYQGQFQYGGTLPEQMQYNPDETSGTYPYDMSYPSTESQYQQQYPSTSYPLNSQSLGEMNQDESMPDENLGEAAITNDPRYSTLFMPNDQATEESSYPLDTPRNHITSSYEQGNPYYEPDLYSDDH